MKALTAIAVLALALTAFAGCGGGSSNKNSSTTATTSTSTNTTPATTTPSSKGAASTLTVDADPSGQLKFTKSTLTAKQGGQVTIKMSNPSPVQHAIGVKGSGVQQTGATVGKGGVSTVTVNLKAGKYEFYCPVDGHEAAGMKGTLFVK